MKKRRFLAGILVMALLLAQLSILPAQAEARIVVTLGANLSPEQRQSILQFFGVQEGQVETLTITNEDERAQLEGLIPLEQIGTRTYSCALVSPTTFGGIQVKTANMNYVTSNMIASNLSTSGVVNCDVLTAAPFVVSGTGALTGVMMAYETASGETLDEEKKELANEELITTNEIAGTIGQDEATLVVNDIKIHIIRDEIKEQKQVNMVVDDVVETTYQASAERAAALGEPEPAQLGQAEHEKLYTYGYKISQMDYKYDDVKATLERVTMNATENIGIYDPIVETFETTGSSTVAEDSVLRNTDDQALGDDAGINSTYQEKTYGAESVTAGNRVPIEPVKGVSIKEVSEVQAGQFVDGTMLLGVSGDGGTALATVDGQMLTDSSYRSFYCHYGKIIEARLEDGDTYPYGVLSTSGKELVPFQYDELEVLNKNWVMGVTLTPATEDDYDYETFGSDKEYYQIAQADLYFLGGEDGALAASLTRDQMGDARARGEYVNVKNRVDGTVTTYDSSLQPVATVGDIYQFNDEEQGQLSVFRDENGNHGVANADGSVVIPADENDYYIYEDRGYIEAELYLPEEEKFLKGLYDLEGNAVIPVLYGRIASAEYTPLIRSEVVPSDDYCAVGYFQVEKEDKIGFVTDGGTELCPPVYPKESVERICGASFVAAGDDGNMHLVSGDGYDVTLDGLYASNVRPVNYSSGMFWYGDGTNGYDLFDWHGNILAMGLSNVSMSGDGTYLILTKNGTHMLYQVSYLTEGVEEPQAEVSETGLKTMAQGRPENAIDYNSESVTAGNRVSIEPAKGVFLTEIGEPEAEEMVDGASLLVLENEDLQYALGDLSGKPVTEYKYSYGFYGNHGMISAKEDKEDLHRAGVLSASGKELVPFQYVEVELFNEHWAAGTIAVASDESDYDYETYGGEYYKVDQVDFYYVDGEDVILAGTLGRDDCSDFRAQGEYLNVENSEGVVTTYDPSFQAVAQAKDIYTFPNSVENRFQSFSDSENHYGVADMDGNVIIPAKYSGIYLDNSSDCYIEVYNRGENSVAYGLCDFEGNEVLPAMFDYIQCNNYYIPKENAQLYSDYYCSFGYFRVQIEDKQGFAVEGGEITGPLTYGDFVNVGGAAATAYAEDGSLHLVSGDGYDVEIEKEYEYVYPLEYSGGMLWYGQTEDGKDVFDWHGTLLFTDVRSCEVSGNGRYLLVSRDDEKKELYEINYLEEGSVAEAAAESETTAPEPETAAESEMAAPEPETAAESEMAAPEPETAAESEIAAPEPETAAESEMAAPEPETAAESETTAPEPETAAESETTAPEPETAAESETTAPESEAAAGTDGVKTLLDSALMLTQNGFEANSESIKVILSQAVTMTQGSNDTASAVLQSAVTLIESGAADEATVTTLIQSAEDLL